MKDGLAQSTENGDEPVKPRKHNQKKLAMHLSTQRARKPQDLALAQHDASDYLSEIQDLAYDTYMLSERRTDSVLDQDQPQRPSIIRRISTSWRAYNGVLDQDKFTENLIKRLSLTRRLSATAPNTLPPVIETYFEVNTIRITKPAALLPAMAANMFEQLHPLLALNIRNLEFHIKLSFRPLYGGLRDQKHSFEVKPEHISNCEKSLSKIMQQLPKLRSLIIVLDTLFDLPPRPRDYQRFLRSHHYHSGSSREEKIRNSDLQEKVAVNIVPCLRSLTKGTELGRIAIKHHPGTSREELEVVNGMNSTDRDVAAAILDQHGREVVLVGWL